MKRVTNNVYLRLIMDQKLFFLFFLLTAFSITAQNPYSEKIKEEGQKMLVAMVEGNVEEIFEYTFLPRIAFAYGGKDTIVAFLKEEFLDKMENITLSLDNMKIGEPGRLYEAGSELHCIVPQYTLVRSNNIEFKYTLNYLAVSQDDGENWYFLTGMEDQKKALIFFPNWNMDMPFPEFVAREIVID